VSAGKLNKIVRRQQNKDITFICPEKKMDAYKKLIKNADAPKDASFATVSTPVEIEIDF